MKKRLISSLIFVSSAAMLLAGCNFKPASDTSKVDDSWDSDPVEYEKDDRISYDKPSLSFDLKAEESSAKIVIPDKVIIHYHNDDMAVKNRRFYTWVTGIDGVERKADSYSETDMCITLDFSVLTDYKDLPSIFFIVKVAGTWAGQSQDIEVKYEDWQDLIIANNNVLEIWSIPGEGSMVELYGSEAETQFPKIKTAKFTDWKTIHCEASEVPMYYNLYAFDKNYLMGTQNEQIAKKQFHLFKSGTPSSSSFDIKFNHTAKINVQYLIETEYASNPKRIQKIIVSSENLYENDRFEEFYTYTGAGTEDLGVTYTPTETKFKVWAPTAAMIYVKIYSNGAPKSLGGSDTARSYIMTYQPKGVWSCTITDKDLAGSYYTYSITNSSGVNETIDPYAKACGINGIRGYIYDKDAESANPTGLKTEWDALKSKWQKEERYTISSPQDLSVYEVHIRDLTMDETWVSNNDNKRGTYNAFSESGTTYSKGGKTVTTGFDHIKELGVKAVQLVPVFDNDNDERPEKMKFNWGYNPLNYNCVEGGYSSDPSDPLARIREYKNLVYQYATKGADSTRVIMDVVYNHMASATSSSFHKLMPKYYFRYDEKWNFYDGSGCNNEVKTEATMMSKFIVESLCWWAKEYQIKGFRFDLMGLIDTWTLRAAQEALFKIDPSIVVYGEGWTSGGYHGEVEYDQSGNLINGGAETSLVYQQLYPTQNKIGIGAFSDTTRNAIKGSNDDGYNNNPYPTWGYISQGTGDVGDKASTIADSMKGIHTGKGGNPSQTINYVSCHDNYTLWDQLTYTLATNGYKDNHMPLNGGQPDVYDLMKASMACHAASMMSNGIGFIQGGEEIYRTKTYPAEELAKGRADGTIRTYPTYPHYSEDPDVLIASYDVEMFNSDNVICHNSYKACDGLNSFKWDRKISIDGKDTSWGNEVWKKMIQERKKIEKYSYGEMESSSEYINSWNTNSGSSVFATWVNGSRDITRQDKGYYFVFAGRSGGFLPISLSGCSIAFINTKDGSGVTPTEQGGNSGINVAPYTYVCYKKGY